MAANLPVGQQQQQQQAQQSQQHSQHQLHSRSLDQRPSSGVSSLEHHPEKPHDVLGGTTIARNSASTNSLSSRSLASGNGRDSRGFMDQNRWNNVRTLPSWLPPRSWVQRREEDEDDLIEAPPTAHRRPPERSVHDARREATPVTISPQREHASRWRGFVEVTSYPPNSSQSEKRVDDGWLSEQGDLSSPWLSNPRDMENQRGVAAEEADGVLFAGSKTRQIWYKRTHIMLLNNPMVPLTFRALIWVLSLLALGLACSVFQLSNKYEFAQKPSTIMAIIVDVVALIYLIYITYDEYSGKPLGLRSPKAKMRLIMFDLLFIIFDSANLSLAFDTLFDVRWSCQSTASSADFGNDSNITRTVGTICERQRALAAFLFLALCAWISTFTVSVFRLVERVSSGARS